MRPQFLVIALTALASIPSFAKMEAHEWGTFTSLIGSNGITQDGMTHEDEILPNFVHEFGELRAEAAAPRPTPAPLPNLPRPCRSKFCFDENFFDTNIVTQKMETPVIYFYADRAMNVSVQVRFPQGIVTQTYPGPVRTSPTKTDIQRIENGDTTFDVEILNQKIGDFPYVAETNIYSHARKVASNAIRSGAEQEKFIFYRGIGRFQPSLAITSRGNELKMIANKESVPQAAFLVHVNSSGEGQIMALSSLVQQGDVRISSEMIQALQDHRPLGVSLGSKFGAVRGEQARGMLVDALIGSGLYRDEAFAMINTWEHGYLKVPGLRLLYILPVNEVEETLPLTMTPAPDKLVRSFVGRIEILLESEERQILQKIAEQQSLFQPASLGRFAEPILRRVREVYQEQPLRDPALELLLTDLVRKAQKAGEAEVLN